MLVIISIINRKKPFYMWALDSEIIYVLNLKRRDRNSNKRSWLTQEPRRLYSICFILHDGAPVGWGLHSYNNKKILNQTFIHAKLISHVAVAVQRSLNWCFTELRNKCIIIQCKPGLLIRTHIKTAIQKRSYRRSRRNRGISSTIYFFLVQTSSCLHLLLWSETQTLLVSVCSFSLLVVQQLWWGCYRTLFDALTIPNVYISFQ